MLKSLPIRVRMTLAFALVMAVVLGAVGLFLYKRLESDLNASVNQDLRNRGSSLVTVAQGWRAGRPRVIPRAISGGDDSFAQVLTPEGRVFAGSPQVGGTPTLSTAELATIHHGRVFRDLPRVERIDGPPRVLVSRLMVGHRPLVAVAGSSLSDRNDTLGSLARQLLIGGPIALLLASLAAYGASAGALRPVEALRRQAALISTGESGDRLPVPAARDELRRLAETLNRMLGRLAESLERERRFVDDASHELRTPLALQRAELEMALRYEGDAEGLRAAIASAIEDVDRLSALAEDLLVISRSSSGEVAVTPQRIDLGPVFEQLRTGFSQRAADLGRPFAIESADGLQVEADPSLLGRALSNLVDNALRHGAGPVEVWGRSEDGHIGVHVRDHGPGMDPEFIDRAFERFSRSKVSGADGGSGLGLSIVEAIAQAHGGRARARNLPGGGVEVWIELPAKRSSAGA